MGESEKQKAVQGGKWGMKEERGRWGGETMRGNKRNAQG